MVFGHRESILSRIISGLSSLKPLMENRTKQYKSKLKAWGLGKNIKETDMRAIVRKYLKRKVKIPSRASIFRLRKRLVPTEKIERYRRDHGLVEETIVSDAGTQYRLARIIVAFDDILNIATPSDLSCDTPVSVAADGRESPSQFEKPSSELHDAQAQLASPPNPLDLAYGALTAAAANLPAEIASHTPIQTAVLASAVGSVEQAFNWDGARGSMPSKGDANDPFEGERYSSYVELLIPLMTQLRNHGLLGQMIGIHHSPANFYLHGFMDYIQEFRNLTDTPWTLNQPLTLTDFWSNAPSSLMSSSSWLVNRLRVVYTTLSFGKEPLRSYAGKGGLVPLLERVDSFMHDFDIKNPKVWSCIDRGGLWPFFLEAHVTSTRASYWASLGQNSCNCIMCLKLPKLLRFYNTMEAFQLYAIAETFGYTLNNTCYKILVERTRVLPQDYIEISEMHQRFVASRELHRNHMPVSAQPDDSNRG